MCDRWCCLYLVLHTQLPPFFTLLVRSVCLVCSGVFLLWHLVNVPSAQQSWHELSWPSLRSVRELPPQTASHRVSSLIHRYLRILSYCGELLRYIACLGCGVTVLYCVILDLKLHVDDLVTSGTSTKHWNQGTVIAIVLLVLVMQHHQPDSLIQFLSLVSYCG
jgi:hypothetical protein